MNCIPNQHVIILIIIIIGLGWLAGFSNYLNYKASEKDGKIPKIKFVVSAIGSASLVPLLLNMLSSNLIKDGIDFNQINYFVFAGFCFIAGFFSERFINSMGEKILRDLENTKDKANEAISTAKDNEEKLDFIVASESDIGEVESTFDITDFKILSKFNDDDIGEQVKNVIKSFNGRYKLRTVAGISKEVGYSINIIQVILDTLENSGIMKKLGKDREILWGLTKIGQSYLKKIQSED